MDKLFKKPNLKILITVILSVTVILFLVVITPFFISLRIYPRAFKNLIDPLSEKYNIDKNLVYGVVKTESGFNSNAVSGAGAIGLMQLMPDTAKFIAEQSEIVFEKDKLTNAKYNITLGIIYLKYLMRKFTEIEHILLAYNAGEGKVAEWLKTDNPTLETFEYLESRNYVKKVLNAYNIYSNRKF